LCTCCRQYPGAATGCLVCSLPQPYQPSPIRVPGRPTHRPFRGLLGVHSRYGLHTRAVTVFRDSFTEGFNRFVTSTVAPVASGWSSCRVGLSPTGKRRLLTAHPNSGQYRGAGPVNTGPMRQLTLGAGDHGAGSCAPNRYHAVPSQRTIDMGNVLGNSKSPTALRL